MSNSFILLYLSDLYSLNVIPLPFYADFVLYCGKFVTYGTKHLNLRLRYGFLSIHHSWFHFFFNKLSVKYFNIEKISIKYNHGACFMAPSFFPVRFNRLYPKRLWEYWIAQILFHFPMESRGPNIMSTKHSHDYQFLYKLLS